MDAKTADWFPIINLVGRLRAAGIYEKRGKEYPTDSPERSPTGRRIRPDSEKKTSHGLQEGKGSRTSPARRIV